MNINISHTIVLVLIVLVDVVISKQQQAYPKLVYLVPEEGASQHVINTRDSLTNSLIKGWVFKAHEEYTLLAYILVDHKIYSLEDIEYGFIYFTTNKVQCQTENDLTYAVTEEGEMIDYKSHKNSNLIFRLDFLPDRSRFLRQIDGQNIEIKQKRRLNQRDHQSSMQKNDTILVGRVNIRLKYSSNTYYTCVFFSKKDSMTSTYKYPVVQTGENITDLLFVHQGVDNIFSQIITTEDLLPIYVVICLYFILLCFSALFSGLNLGLMSLDLTELNLLKKIGSRKEKKYAKKIYPLRKRGNLLLCTILIGNVLVNSSSTLILGNYLEGLFAAVGSTMLIVIFGEIIPQAVCSRYGLAVGAFTRHVTYFMMGLTFIVSYPLSKILDVFLGKEIAQSYSRDKVRELMRQAKDGKDIEEKQFKLISGALDFKHKCVKDIMVEVKDVFSLDINSILDFDTFKTILYHGYSRIPVFEHTKENFVGMILIQDLLLNDPADKVPLRAVMEFYKHRVPKCKKVDKLEVMFEKFRKGDSHMAFVYNDDTDLESSENGILESVGIVTLENIIEALVQSEIMDEADTRREKRRRRAKDFLKGKLANVSLSTENLNIFVTEVDQTNAPVISTQIKKALFYFLASSVRPFMGEFISPKILEAFLRQPELMKEKRNLSENDIYLYKYGQECDYFILILDGSAVVQVGIEGMEINAGLFSYYGLNALLDENEKDPFESITNDATRKPYKPEFSLKVNSYCVYIKISRKDWKDAVKKSLMERMYGIIPQSVSDNSNMNLNNNNSASTRNLNLTESTPTGNNNNNNNYNLMTLPSIKHNSLSA